MTAQIVPKAFIPQSADTPSVWPRADWWLSFESPELAELIRAAQENNRNLAAALARVMEAQAQTRIARSALFPQLDLSAQAQRSGAGAAAGSGATGSAGMTTASGAATPASAMGASKSGSTRNAFDLGIGASYELDVWGLARANLRAAQEALKSARFAQEAMALSITAGVADGYFTVLALRERIAIAREDIAAINGILDIIKLRVATGTSSHLDLAQEQAQAESVEAQLPVLQEQELETRVALAVLLGRPPEVFEVKARSSSGIQLPPAAPGIPSELLLRRPDVAAAEANLARAHANLDAARAAFLPQFALTGTAGFASTAVGALLRGPSFVWGAGTGLLQTIFDGALIGQRNLAAATQRELIASYQSAVLNAYADVESALGQVQNTAEAQNHLRREVDAAREAFGIAQLQYRQGAAELLTVLQAQQTLFAARDQLAQIQLARMQAVVHLFEALGGGWAELPSDRTQFPSGREVGGEACCALH
jgi:NodT family efflux transporter outer membrane factor (OMF) lipoprotein